MPLTDCRGSPAREGLPHPPGYYHVFELMGAEREAEEALEVICEESPLPFIAQRTICAHNCMSKCTPHASGPR